MSHKLSKSLLARKLMLVPLLALGLAASPGAMAKPDHDRGSRHSEYRHDHRDHHRGDHRDHRRHDRDHRDWRGDRYRVNVYQAPRGHHHRQWHRGERLPVVYRESRYVVRDYRSYRLEAPPRGHHWVRVDNDVILTAVTTGVVAAVVYGIFH